MKNESKVKYEANGKPYLVMSKKDEFGQKHQYFYRLENFEPLYNIPTDKLRNGDIAVVKKNNSFVKFMWIVDDDWNYENWVSCGKLNWKPKEKIESETENMNENNKVENNQVNERDLDTILYDMTCDQIKAKYPTLNSIYYNCWCIAQHYILDYCDVTFASRSETNREAKVTIRLKSNIMNCNDAVTFTVEVYSLYNPKDHEKKYSNIVNVRINEMQDCSVFLLKLIVVTSELLEQETKNLDLSETNNESYDRLIGLLDEFKLFKYQVDCESDDCDDEGM